MERQKVKKMTFKEKLQMEHPEIKTAKECKCPSDYGYEGYATKVDCLLGNCEACWNREIPFEDTKDYWYKKGLNDAWELALKFSKMVDVPSDVTVENVHLSDSLMKLSYKINCKNE